MRPFDPAVLRALPSTRGPVALLSVVGVLAGAVSIAQALVLAVAVGRVVGGGELVPTLRWLVALLVLRGLLSGLGEVVARRAGLRVAGVLTFANAYTLTPRTQATNATGAVHFLPGASYAGITSGDDARFMSDVALRLQQD